MSGIKDDEFAFILIFETYKTKSSDRRLLVHVIILINNIVLNSVVKMEIETRHYDFQNESKMCQSVNKRPKISKLDECINSIVRKEGYVSCDIVKKTIPADGGNYLATLFEIDVKGKTADGEKETAIFVKSIDSDCEAMELISVPGVYKTELFVYKELSLIFNVLQDDANVPTDERYNTVKCYEESYEKAIIMENLTRKGFKIAGDRMSVIPLNIAEECVKQLAKLHALSYVLEQRMPEYFAKKVKTMKNPLIFGEGWKKFYENFCKQGLECLDDELRKKIEEKIPTAVKKFETYNTDESIMYCLRHGDYKPNNIMAKEVDGKMTVIPVDYQIISFGCPVFDFIFFMYCSTDRKFRNAHMIDLKNLYYKSLEDFLRYFYISAESVFPRKTFDHIYEEKLDYGLAVSFLFCPFLFVSENAEVPDITKEGLGEIDFQLDDKFKDRLRDAVEEFIDLGFL